MKRRRFKRGGTTQAKKIKNWIRRRMYVSRHAKGMGVVLSISKVLRKTK